MAKAIAFGIRGFIEYQAKIINVHIESMVRATESESNWLGEPGMFWSKRMNYVMKSQRNEPGTGIIWLLT